LLALRHRHVLPLIKNGFTQAKAELLGRRREKEGISIVWRTIDNDSVQIITNFADTSMPMPKIEGDIIWNSERSPTSDVLRPQQIIVAVDAPGVSP
jgi:hypothetical protein